jgi:hypothetical protein
VCHQWTSRDRLLGHGVFQTAGLISEIDEVRLLGVSSRGLDVVNPGLLQGGFAVRAVRGNVPRLPAIETSTDLP